MSEIEKAARDAVEAADNTETVRLIAAVLAAQQHVQTQHQPPAPAPVQQRPYGAYAAAGIGGAVALTALAMAAALLAVAVAVGAVCATVCLLVLKSLLDDYTKGRR
jgi:hypothetical protein